MAPPRTPRRHPPRRRYHAHPLKPRVDRLPRRPGVYLMKDADGTILYVGKALDLRARVRSYFNGTDSRPRMHRLMRELVDLEVSLTGSEQEALLLEAQLIVQHRPRYNVALKSKRRLRFLSVSLHHPYPRLEVSEDPPEASRTFGPLRSGWHARQLQELLERTFQVRTCDDREFGRRDRPCLQSQVGLCPAPCMGQLDSAEYLQRFVRMREVLETGATGLMAHLEQEMQQAADREDFESAARLRDYLRSLTALSLPEPPPVPGPERDVLGLARVADEVAVAIVPVRWGRQQPVEVVYLERCLEDSGEVLANVVVQHYQAARQIPAMLVLPSQISRQELPFEALQNILSGRAGVPVLLESPPDCAALHTVASQAAEAELSGVSDENGRVTRALEDLTRLLNLPRPPRGIDWLGIPVGEQRLRHLSWQADRPLPGQLHTRALKTAGGCPEEGALERILIRLLKGEHGPDLIVLEGGRSLLALAGAILARAGAGAPGTGLPTLIGIPAYPVPALEGAADLEWRGLLLPGRRNLLRVGPHRPARALLESLRRALHAGLE